MLHESYNTLGQAKHFEGIFILRIKVWGHVAWWHVRDIRVTWPYWQ